MPKKFILYTIQTALLRLCSSVHFYKITQTRCYIVGFQATKFPLLQKSKTEVGMGSGDSLEHRLPYVWLFSVLCPSSGPQAKNLRRNSNETTAISSKSESAPPLLLLQSKCYWFLTDMLKNVCLL